MQNWMLPYWPVLAALGAMGGLMLIQILVVDVAGIRARHPPGKPVEADHANFLFRATRAHGNTNESIAVFLLLALFGVFSGAPAAWLNGLTWVYVAGRIAHMLCYYADLKTLRSTAFAIALAALIGMLVAGVLPWVP